MRKIKLVCYIMALISLSMFAIAGGDELDLVSNEDLCLAICNDMDCYNTCVGYCAPMAVQYGVMDYIQINGNYALLYECSMCNEEGYIWFEGYCEYHGGKGNGGDKPE
jgi:hypothetical protein